MTLGLSSAVAAQESSVVHVVSYIEVEPAAAEQVAELLASHEATSRDDAGNLSFKALQRIGRPNHFALIESWSTADSHAAHQLATHNLSLREELAPVLLSPYDQRMHGQFGVVAFGDVGGQLFALTHIDIAPPKLESGMILLEEAIDVSRDAPGNTRFDLLVQGSRRNHMTLVETWESAESKTAHTNDPTTRDYRSMLTPLMGSLSDERLYTPL
jgi:quinol monooxygenase YgiN